MSNSESVQKLREQFKSLRRLYFLFLVLAVLALVLYFWQPKATLVLLGISLILNLVLGRKKTKAYVSAFCHLSAQITLEKHLKDALHTAIPVLKESSVREARMLPCNAATGGVICKEGGTGTYHGNAVALGDVTLAHSFTVDNKKRHNFLVGTWLTIVLDFDTQADCRFLGEHAAPPQSIKEMLWVESDLQQVPCPASLRHSWKVISTEGSAPTLPDRFLRQLDRLHDKMEGRVAVCLQGNQLHVMLIGEILAQTISGRVAPGSGFEQADLLPHLSDALCLADKLKV